MWAFHRSTIYALWTAEQLPSFTFIFFKFNIIHLKNTENGKKCIWEDTSSRTSQSGLDKIYSFLQLLIQQHSPQKKKKKREFL